MLRGRLLAIALLSVAVASLSACGGSGSGSADSTDGDATTPSPSPSPSPAPSPAPAATASLSWAPVADADVAGYKVYYGTSSGTYVQAAGAGVDIGNTTSYTLTGLVSGTNYYFAVSAYDAARNESALSAEVAKQVQ